MKPSKQELAEVAAYRTWKGILLALFAAIGEEEPDEETIAIQFDHQRTPREAMALILGERDYRHWEG